MRGGRGLPVGPHLPGQQHLGADRPVGRVVREEETRMGRIDWAAAEGDGKDRSQPKLDNEVVAVAWQSTVTPRQGAHVGAEGQPGHC